MVALLLDRSGASWHGPRAVGENQSRVSCRAVGSPYRITCSCTFSDRSVHYFDAARREDSAGVSITL